MMGVEILQADVERALRIAVWWNRSYAPRANFDDLAGPALEGLAKAANRYKSGDFWKYAVTRVIGEMRDELRKADHLTRKLRKAAVGEDENISIEGMPWVNAMEPEHLDAFTYSDGEAIEHTISASRPAYDEMEHGDAIRRAMRKLSARQRFVFLSLAAGYQNIELAAVLHLSAARVSQINNAACALMRAELADSLMES